MSKICDMGTISYYLIHVIMPSVRKNENEYDGLLMLFRT